jgi:hypothetical protein
VVVAIIVVEKFKISLVRAQHCIVPLNSSFRVCEPVRLGQRQVRDRQSCLCSHGCDSATSRRISSSEYNLPPLAMQRSRIASRRRPRGDRFASWVRGLFESMIATGFSIPSFVVFVEFDFGIVFVCTELLTYYDLRWCAVTHTCW